jgi:hypothetical protein
LPATYSPDARVPPRSIGNSVEMTSIGIRDRLVQDCPVAAPPRGTFTGVLMQPSAQLPSPSCLPAPRRPAATHGEVQVLGLLSCPSVRAVRATAHGTQRLIASMWGRGRRA